MILTGIVPLSTYGADDKSHLQSAKYLNGLTSLQQKQDNKNQADEDEKRKKRERQEQERRDQERKDQERKDQERKDQQRKDQERMDQQRREQERRDQERKDDHRNDQDRDRQDRERLERERKEHERREQERREQERREQERREQERREQERREQERREQERREQERREQERREQERREQEYREHRNAINWWAIMSGIWQKDLAEQRRRERREEAHRQWERWENEHRDQRYNGYWHLRNVVQEQKDCRYIIRRTSQVIAYAQRMAGLRHYTIGLSRAITHQQIAYELYKDHFYWSSIYHSFRARSLAMQVINGNRDLSFWKLFANDPVEDRYRRNAPDDGELDIWVDSKAIASDDAMIHFQIQMNLDN
jgi:hypothetical protein